jgi:chaperonin cofactor prefoldin
MSSLAKMKLDLQNLEKQREQLELKIGSANKQFKVGLWVIGGGITLIPLYGFGVIFLLGGILYALYNSERKSHFRDALEDVENKIQILEESMA